MTVALFIPCYIDQFYPQVGIATYNLLRKFNLDVTYPKNQTCCGQPMANAGMEHAALAAYENFASVFCSFDFVVAPSGSCVYHVREHYDLLPQTEELNKLRSTTYELTDFLVDVLRVNQLDGAFNHRVGLHLSCHGQRGLRNSSCSEVTDDRNGNAQKLLKSITGLELATLDRYDECCGFGGTFCVTEDAVSSRMGVDRLADHLKNRAEVITGGDMSCLMHLQGLAARRKASLKIMHIAEILDTAKL
jgi:L-lactate dehydrogenase complex protein LldE